MGKMSPIEFEELYELTKLAAVTWRHTCFTRLREGGMAISALQAQAGHRSIASTRIYLHLRTGWLAGEYKHAVEAIEAQAAVGAARLARPPLPSHHVTVHGSAEEAIAVWWRAGAAKPEGGVDEGCRWPATHGWAPTGETVGVDVGHHG
jgi:Phage integrase family